MRKDLDFETSKKTLIKHKFLVFSTISVLLFILFFSLLAIEKYALFSISGWGLGLVNKFFYISLFRESSFATYVDYLRFFGGFFTTGRSPVMFLFFPFYYLFPGAETLLTLQSFAVGLAAIPLFYLSSRMLKSERLSFLVVLVYLLNPGLHIAALSNFCMTSFAPLTFFLTIYYYKKKNVPFFIFLLLTILLGEYSTILILAFSLSKITFIFIEDLKKYDLKKIIAENALLIYINILSLSFYLVFRYFRTSYLCGTFEYNFFQNYVFYGYKIVFYLVFAFLLFIVPLFFIPLISNVYRANAILVLFFVLLENRCSYGEMANYIFILTPLLFIAFLDALKMHLSQVGALFSESSIQSLKNFVIVLTLFLAPIIYYTLGYYFLLYLIPFLLIFGLKSPADLENKDLHQNLIRNVVILAILTASFLTPISPFSNIVDDSNLFYYGRPNRAIDEVESLKLMTELVPEESSILTQRYIFTHFTTHNSSYFLNEKYDPFNSTYFVKSIHDSIEKFEYVLLDLQQDEPWTLHTLNYSQMNNFGIFALSDSLILLKQNYSGPLVFVPELSSKKVITANEIYSSSLYSYNQDQVLSIHEKTIDNSSYFYIKQLILPPGLFDVTFVFNYSHNSYEDVGEFAIWTPNQGFLFRGYISPREQSSDGLYNYSAKIYLDELISDSELRVYNTGHGYLYFDKIIISQSNGYELAFDVYNDMSILQGILIRDNTSRTGHSLYAEAFSTNGTISCGPYVSLPPGDYIANFSVKVPNPTDSIILAIDVTGMEGAETYARRVIYGDELETSSWTNLSLPFTSSKFDSKYEFRVITSGYADLYFDRVYVEKIP